MYCSDDIYKYVLYSVVSKTCGMELPTRKKRYEGGGQLGRKIQVRTNFMPLNLKNICKMAVS